MKPLSILVATMIFLSSCNSSQKEMNQLKAQNDSLEKVIVALKSKLPVPLELPDETMTATLNKYSSGSGSFIPSVTVTRGFLKMMYEHSVDCDKIRFTVTMDKKTERYLQTELFKQDSLFEQCRSPNTIRVPRDTTIGCCPLCPPLKFGPSSTWVISDPTMAPEIGVH